MPTLYNKSVEGKSREHHHNSGGEGYIIKFYTGRLRPWTQALTLKLILNKMEPLSYTSSIS